MIEFENVSFSYEDVLILEKLSIKIEFGKFIGIIGPNGGGKTTFLKLLMGILKPSLGKILIDGIPSERFRTSIGYVPQIRYFDRAFPISVYELVLMGALSRLTWWGRYDKKSHSQAKEVLERVDLLDMKDAPFGSLSGGQAQRALIARALMGHPKLLLLDEPTASIDPHAEEKIRSIILSLRHKITILMVTHELPGMIDQVDEVLCINKQIKIYPPSQVCGHFALGLYHRSGR